ncbi:FAD-binding oxidoreductase [Robertmurraya yapensis]|uniref:FAD-binding oxidoreductase n=1 Tax=Bacillus yapensis TaxID=2492960 RepID=A0A431WK63_9BACI|nr:FAD-binding oxidoreductase [Bacillus yapensis]TKT05511.1 FAD-binding protein [Bacillus yapensis]
MEANFTEKGGAILITSDLKEELRTVVPIERIKDNQEIENSFGNSGKIIVAPATEEEISEVLKYANAHGKKISVIAGGTKRGFGGVNETEDILLSLSNYTGIVEHTVGDMTLTVKAGTSFKEIQDYLAGYNQKISLDPSWSEAATIGGVIAANDSGPKRLGYGSARDVVIGLRVVYPDGTVIRSGGKVVKNVAGYDMNKLFIGSMGTIGVISEVTVKLRPVPKYESLVLLTFPDGDLLEIKSFVVNFLDSVMEPITLEILNPSIAEKLGRQKRYTLAISFEDVESSVHYQEEFVKRIKPANADIIVVEKDNASEFWEKFYHLSPRGTEPGHDTEATVKVGVVNLDVLKIIQKAEQLSDAYNLRIEAHGGLGHGLCQVHLYGASEDVEGAIKELRIYATSLGGYATIKHLPLVLRQKISVWGERPSYFFLFEGIKKKIDPNKILNPNRFIGGI